MNYIYLRIEDMEKDVMNVEGFQEKLINKLSDINKMGIHRVVLASYYYDDESVNIETVRNMVFQVNEILKEKAIPVVVYSANLVKANIGNLKQYIKGNVGTINASRYLLLEIEEDINEELLDIIYELKLRDVVPVIVSPEKNISIIKNIKEINKLINEDCLFQLDLKSIEGVYGKEVKEVSKYLFKKDIYDCISINEEDKKISDDKKFKDLYKFGGMIIKNELVEKHIELKK